MLKRKQTQGTNVRMHNYRVCCNLSPNRRCSHAGCSLHATYKCEAGVSDMLYRIHMHSCSMYWLLERMRIRSSRVYDAAGWVNTHMTMRLFMHTTAAAYWLFATYTQPQMHPYSDLYAIHSPTQYSMPVHYVLNAADATVSAHSIIQQTRNMTSACHT